MQLLENYLNTFEFIVNAAKLQLLTYFSGTYSLMKKKQATPPIIKKDAKSEKKTDYFKWIWYLIIPVLTFLVYQSVTTFDSTNWDDKAYLQETPMIRDLNMEKTKAIFTKKVLNSYNPIVLLTFAYDYKISKLKPGWCHAVNLFFHLMNAILVFVCMRKLRFKTNHAGIIALLFALHPLSTEAVAWIAGRKDVVYLFFFLLSWKFYLDYFHSTKKLFLFVSIFFFILSLLSKVQAITLPFILIASDLMLDQKFDSKRFLNKIPYFILAIIFGVIAVSGSGELMADKYTAPFTLLDKLVYSIMAFGLYLQKIILPFNQIAIYQFPEPGSSAYIIDLLVGIIAIGAIVVGFIFSMKKNPRLAGGLLIFAVSIFPVLHLVAVNSALIYERFVYLAGIGIFIAAFALIERFPKQEMQLTYVAIAICILFTGLTVARIPIWKNSLSLWTDIIAKDPTAADAYTNRGQYYESINDYDKAFLDFSESVRLEPNKPGGYHNRAVSYFHKKDFALALKDNQRVLDIDPKHTDALVNRGAIYFNMNQNDSAIFYYKKALEVTPGLAKAYYNCGAAYFNMKDFSSAAFNFKKATEYISDYTDAYTYLALSNTNLFKFEEAEFAINASEKYTPNSAARTMVSNELIQLGNAAYRNGKPDEALNLYTESARIMPSNAEAYFNLGGIYLMKKEILKARENWQKTLSLNPNHAEAKNWLTRTAGAK